METLLLPLLYILFVLAAILLVVVVLIQEGKGGGFGDAFGGQASQTFGVGAKGINRFTGWVAFAFLACAVAIHLVHRGQVGESVLDGEVMESVEGISADEGAASGGDGSDG